MVRFRVYVASSKGYYACEEKRVDEEDKSVDTLIAAFVDEAIKRGYNVQYISDSGRGNYIRFRFLLMPKKPYMKTLLVSLHATNSEQGGL